MTPAAVDLIKLTQLPPSAPSPAVGPETAAPSFQDHLRRAEGRAKTDTTNPRDCGRPSTPDAGPSRTAEAKNKQDRSTDEQPHIDDSNSVADEKPESTDGEKQETSATVDVTAEAAPIVTQVLSVVAELKPPPSEMAEAVIADETPEAAAIEKPIVDPTPKTPPVPIATTAVVDVVGDVEQTTKRKNDADEPAAASKIDPVAAEIDVVEQTEAGVIKTSVRHAASSKSDVVATSLSTAEPATTNVVATPTTTSAVKAEADRELPAVRDDAKQGTRDAGPSTPTAGVALNVTSASPVSAAAVEAIGVAKADVTESKPAAETGTKPNTKDNATTTARLDRTHAADVPQLVAHRDRGLDRVSTTDDAATLSQGERVRLVQRVARAVQTATERGGDLKLRLSPPELGSLRLQVRLTDGVLSARIEADNPAAKQVLIDNLPALRERLADQNIRVEKFDVDLSNNGGGGASQTPQQQFSDAGHRNSRSGPGRTAGASVAAANESVGGNLVGPTIGDDRLNVII